MPRSYHNETYHHQVRFIKRVRRVLSVLLGIILLVAVAIGIDSLLQDQDRSLPSQSTQPNTVSYAPKVKIFRNQYFQFQTDDSWSEIVDKTTPNTYTYRSLRGSLIEHELKIYVNNSPDRIEATYVLPVNTTSNGELLPLTVSEHCRKALPDQAKLEPREVIMDRVKFYCAADNTYYVAVIGLIDGGTGIELKRPDGSTATYTIVYHNLTASPEATRFYQIAESFQTR